MTEPFFIDGREIGCGHVFVIAELSANHGNDLSVALRTVEAAAWAGADAIKLQTVDPDLITLDCDNSFFQLPLDSPWSGQTYYQLEVDTCLPKEWHLPIFNKAHELGLSCFSSPFDLSAVDFLERLNCPAYKIASYEITDIALIKKVATTGKPVIISTGIASHEDIALAVETCRAVGNQQIVLLKCTSAYPTPLDEVDLRSMPSLGENYDCLFGLSDHTLGYQVALGSVALGSSIIEKHFILNDDVQSADSSFSMRPKEFKLMVESIRNLEPALGSKSLRITPSMAAGRKLSRSLFIVQDVPAGHIFTSENVRSIRPGDGLHPKYLSDILGRSAAFDIFRGVPLTFDMIKQ